MSDSEPRAHKSQKSAAQAGPRADNRFGSGLIATNLQSRILAVTVENGRTRVTMSQGTAKGVRVGMEGYVRGPGGMLSELQIDAVEPWRCHAFVDVTPDELQNNLLVVLNPTSKPHARITKDVRTRVIGVSVESGRTQIIIDRGATNGVTAGMQGHLVSDDGREGDSFTIAGTTARQSIAFVANTVDHVNQHKTVVLRPVRHAAPVQRRANGASSATDVQSTAAAGVAGAASRLPHFDTIQRAFGKHDISGIRAQVGGAATEAAGSLGAHAYATGNTVAFASAPDLHTAAHEAAHAIQQSRGAVGFQGLGAADDEHERHADAVADAVVAGQSAEPLLDSLATGSATTAVQRKEKRDNGSGIGADDLVKSDRLTNLPDRATQGSPDGRVGNEYIDRGAYCDHAGSVNGCFLTPESRARLVTEFKLRVVSASSRCNDAIQALKIHTLLKKPEDMHWVFSLVLDVASHFALAWAAKALIKAKAGKITEYVDDSHDAIQGGHYNVADRIDARKALFQGISDETIKTTVGQVGGLAKTQAKPIIANALADTNDKAETISYLAQLQRNMDTAFSDFADRTSARASDAELVVLLDGMHISNHGSELYEKAISEKVARFKATEITRLGRAQDPFEVGAYEDRRVVWMHHMNGTKTLVYQSTGWKTKGDHVAPYGGTGAGTIQYRGEVPREFWEEAISVSEAKWGPTPTVEDPFNGHNQIAHDQAQKMSSANTASSSAPPSGGDATRILKLFGSQ